MTPFLEAVTSALSYELEKGLFTTNVAKKAIVDEILQNLPAEHSISTFCTNLSLASDTLQDEFDHLRRMNLQ